MSHVVQPMGNCHALKIEFCDSIAAVYKLHRAMYYRMCDTYFRLTKFHPHSNVSRPFNP